MTLLSEESKFFSIGSGGLEEDGRSILRWELIHWLSRGLVRKLHCGQKVNYNMF
jgi:hypothetical protein